MSRTCLACCHPQKDSINRALLDGVGTIRSIAQTAAISEAAMLRHKQHLGAKLGPAAAKSQRARESLSADLILNRVQSLADRLEAALSQAEETGDLGAIGKLSREIRETLRLLGQVVSLFPKDGSGATYNVDARVQVAALQGLTPDELRELIAIARAQQPALTGGTERPPDL